jgi:hypothetical protein
LFTLVIKSLVEWRMRAQAEEKEPVSYA